MAKRKDEFLKEYEVTIDPHTPLFVISVVSELVGIPVWTLRKLDEKGVVKPKRIGRKTRCYTRYQIRKLKYVQHLMDKENVNISGVKVILELKSSS